MQRQNVAKTNVFVLHFRVFEIITGTLRFLGQQTWFLHSCVAGQVEEAVQAMLVFPVRSLRGSPARHTAENVYYKYCRITFYQERTESAVSGTLLLRQEVVVISTLTIVGEGLTLTCRGIVIVAGRKEIRTEWTL